jgi:hypothetical protein
MTLDSVGLIATVCWVIVIAFFVRRALKRVEPEALGADRKRLRGRQSELVAVLVWALTIGATVALMYWLETKLYPPFGRRP